MKLVRELLMSASAEDVNFYSSENGDTALICACSKGYIEIVGMLLADGKVKNVNTQDKVSDTHGKIEVLN